MVNQDSLLLLVMVDEWQKSSLVLLFLSLKCFFLHQGSTDPFLFGNKILKSCSGICMIQSITVYRVVLNQSLMRFHYSWHKWYGQ